MTTTASLLSAAGGIGRLSRSASRVVGKTASGFHLLRVEAYSQTKTVPAGQSIVSTPFSIGKYKWGFKYYPNGRDTTTKSDYISLYLQLYDHNRKKRQLQAQYKLSILDHAGNVAYGLPAKTSIFKSSGDKDDDDSDDDDEEEPQLCGHEQFIRREDLERREDLLKDDCVVFRCDVGGFTELETTRLAREESDRELVPDDDVFGLKPSRYRSSDYGHRRLRRADDNEFVQWCLAQKRMG